MAVKKFAIVKDGVVSNIAIAEDVWPFENDEAIELTDEQQVNIGWSVVDGVIVVPVVETPAAPTEPPVEPTA